MWKMLTFAAFVCLRLLMFHIQKGNVHVRCRICENYFWLSERFFACALCIQYIVVLGSRFLLFSIPNSTF